MLVTEANIQEAFKKEATLKSGFDKLTKKAIADGEIDSFWGVKWTDEFEVVEDINLIGNKLGAKVGDYWKTITMVNGREPHVTYAFWQDGTRYMDNRSGLTLEEQLKDSEQEKVLWKGTDFRISLYRNKIRKPTKTYYGFKILGAEYALINNTTNEVVVLEANKFKFKQAVLGKVRPTDTPIQKLEAINPFKLKAIKATDKDSLSKMDEAMGFVIDTFNERYRGEVDDNMWVVYIIGHPTSKTKFKGKDTRNATWFIYRGDSEPTYQEALEYICEQYLFYRGLEYYQVMEKHAKLGSDFSKLNFYWEEYKNKKLSGKFKQSMEGVFGIEFNSVYNIIFPNAEPLYSRYKITKEGKIPLPNDPVDENIIIFD